MSRMLITNVRIVLPNRILDPGWVYLENGLIIEVGEGLKGKNNRFDVLDGEGAYLLPGLVDIHSDAIEREVQPRPNVFWDVDIACREIERRMVIHGITTIFHTVSFSSGEGVRSDVLASLVVRRIAAMSKFPHLIRNLVHLRYEVSNIYSLKLIENLLEEGTVQLLSFMDHYSDQGQYRNAEDYRREAGNIYRLEEEECLELPAQKMEERKRVDTQQLERLSSMTDCGRIRIASHDDDSREKVDAMLRLGVSIAEFPVNLDTALYARSLGMQVCVGAPNLLRGRSHGNNLSASEALHQRAANILCSDYHPPAFLYAVFRLALNGFGLPAATCTATLNPAIATGLDDRLGSIREGKKGDLILVHLVDDKPVIMATLVEGRETSRFTYRYNGEMVQEEFCL